MNKDGLEKFDDGMNKKSILDIASSRPLENFH